MGLMTQFVDKVAVLYAGQIMELSTVKEMFTDALHPYADALINSLPSLDNKGIFEGIPGLAPALLRLPSGCSFHPRCEHVMDICRTDRPAPESINGRIVACHLHTNEENIAS
jgi:peptide/nickel transport system ATP-binding protein